DRLEPFRTLARQAEQDRKSNRPTVHQPADLLALAVSGWVLGKDSAEAKVATAERLWRARELVLAFQRTAAADERQKLIADYQKNGPVPLDEMSQLISLLPPPDLTPVQPVPQNGLIDRTIQFPGAQAAGRRYLAQLPDEFSPHRAYPL